TNLVTDVGAVSMPVAGVEARVVDLGDQLELRGTPASDLVVIGYQDEPFLRTGPAGVFVNARAHSLIAVPALAQFGHAPDPQAAPEWAGLGGPGLARWHDHRAHWMGVGDPPEAVAQPDREHVIVDDWVVPLRAGAATGSITGDLRWVPP